MKLTTVLASVNDNPRYYNFIPCQIKAWGKFGIRFIAVYAGTSIPDELRKYSDHIVLWDRNLDINTSYVAQVLRIFYPSMLKLPDDELVMITDMDMLPMSPGYYTNGLREFNKDDFIYYRHIDYDQVYMCYNAAHPDTWSEVFGVKTKDDIEKHIYRYYSDKYDGVPGSDKWYSDQRLMFNKLSVYSGLKVLNRPVKRLEMEAYQKYLECGADEFVHKYDDCHFHRDYFMYIRLLEDACSQLKLKLKLNHHI
jgi:hypothetical protein